MKNYGFKKSAIDGSEHSINMPKSLDLPSFYSYEDVLPPVLNQGEEPICVPCTISAYLNWRENLVDGESKDNGIDLYGIYGKKTNDGDGMTYKEAFYNLRHNGAHSNKGILKIREYAILRNPIEMRYAILANGPIFIALPVYNGTAYFWLKNPGDRLLGYHAVSVVGYTERGFIIRNSWGNSFGENGYTTLDVDDLGKILEAWSIVG